MKISEEVCTAVTLLHCHIRVTEAPRGLKAGVFLSRALGRGPDERAASGNSATMTQAQAAGTGGHWPQVRLGPVVRLGRAWEAHRQH